MSIRRYSDGLLFHDRVIQLDAERSLMHGFPDTYQSNLSKREFTSG
jgi:hypothetical protein